MANEARLWRRIKENLPKKSFAQRIETSTGLGVPDVFLLLEGNLATWIELKVTKANAVRVSASQVAWHASYCARGGKSFYLVQGPSPSDLYLFGGDQGSELMDRGLVCGGSRFEDLGSLFEALRLALLPK